MDGKFIDICKENIQKEHICCAFSDKKCAEGYNLKKSWLEAEFEHGYVFRRLDERAKVFIEYCPAENAWSPVEAPGYLFINCFWVSGRYKGKGYGKQLLDSAFQDAVDKGCNGLVTVAGKKKFHFMSDTGWLLRHGFEVCSESPDGFVLLAYKLNRNAPDPAFKPCAFQAGCPEKEGLVAYYSNRCPFTELYVNQMLKEAADNRGIPLRIHKLETVEQAQTAPTPATIFSLYYNGSFVTTDISSCLDSRLDKVIGLK